MMNAIAEGFIFAAAASQPRCAELRPKQYTTTVLKSKLDRVSLSESDERIYEAWNGTEPQFQDWKENFSIRPNRDGIQHAYAETVACFLRALIEFEQPAKKPVTELGHSQGAAHAHVSAFYKRRQAGMRSAGPIGYGGPPWALDERCVPGSVRVTTPRDPVPCDQLKWIPFFRRLKRMPRTEIDGCPGAKNLCVLDHDYIVYARGIARFSANIGDVEGERKMYELMEICNQQWRCLEGI
jgi:hypothetical protein